MNSPTFNPIMAKHIAIGGKNKFHSQGYKGSGITVCVIDTGINPHVEFGSRLLLDKCKNFCSQMSDPTNMFDETGTGHATHVASTIVGKNVGYAPEANVISYKVIDAGGGAWNQDIIEALNYIYLTGFEFIDIVNMSLGGSADITVFTGEYEDAINRVVLDRGIPIIVASGNTGDSTMLYPANFQEVVTVGAVDLMQKKAWFSTSSGEVDVAQVGVDCWGACSTGGYVQMSGTSMATPNVCGIATLLLCKYKTMFGLHMPEEVLYEMLKMNTIDADIQGVDINTGAGFCTLGDAKFVTFYKNTAMRVINGVPSTMDVSCIYQNMRNYLPARHVAESINAEVFWDSSEPDRFDIIA